MRVGRGLIKTMAASWHVRRKVPKALEVAAARVMAAPKRPRLLAQKNAGHKGREAGKGSRDACYDGVRPHHRAS